MSERKKEKKGSQAVVSATVRTLNNRRSVIQHGAAAVLCDCQW